MALLPARLVFAARALQFPAVTGGQLRTQRLLRGLSEAFETSIVTFDHHEDSDEGPTSEIELRRAFPEANIVMVPGQGPRKRLLQLRSALGLRSWSHGRYVSSAYETALRREVARARPAIVHYDDVGTALNGPVAGTINVVAPHNVEYRVVSEMSVHESGVRKLFAAVEDRKLRREEPALWRRMDACVAISDVEARTMAAAGAARVLLAPNGTDPVARVPLSPRRADEPLRLLFVGTGSFQPNEHGLAWFVDEVMPRLRERLPVVLGVVGQPPQRPRMAPDVVYHGRVPSLARFYEWAHVAVVPVHYGGGSRLKTIEAMAFGVPVVSTPIGAEGLPIADGEHYLEAEDPRGFSEAVMTLAHRRLDLDAELERMVSAARVAAETLFWPRIAAALAADYRMLCETASSGAGSRRSARQRR